MVTIRLARDGGKKRPFYHLVATDSRKRRDSGYLERLGFFNPVARGQEEVLRIDQERVRYWLGQGARQSERAAQLISRHARGEAMQPKPRAKPAQQQVAPEQKAEPAPPAEPEAGPSVEPELQTEAEPQAGPEQQAEAEQTAEAAPRTDSEQTAEPAPPAEPEPQPESEPQVEAEPAEPPKPAD